MRVELSLRGDVVITPDNATERYALRAWADRKNNEGKGNFVLDLSPPPMPPSMPGNPEHILEF